VFAIDESEMKTGRPGALYEDTKYISKLGEQFLAGLLDGLTDSEPSSFIMFAANRACQLSQWFYSY
jgi:hypothetical protein